MLLPIGWAQGLLSLAQEVLTMKGVGCASTTYPPWCHSSSSLSCLSAPHSVGGTSLGGRPRCPWIGCRTQMEFLRGSPTQTLYGEREREREREREIRNTRKLSKQHEAYTDYLTRKTIVLVFHATLQTSDTHAAAPTLLLCFGIRSV